MDSRKCGQKKKTHKGTKRIRKKKRRVFSTKKRIFCTGVIIALIIAAVILILVITGNRRERQIGTIENGAYYQEDREIGIDELFDSAESTIPCFGWYEETDGYTWEQKRNYYSQKAEDQIYRDDVRMSEKEEGLGTEDRERWNSLIRQIDQEEAKKGDNENVADNKVLTSGEYWYNSSLRFKAYIILPQSEMVKQTARNAADALTVLLTKECSQEEGRDDALKYGQRAYSQYVCLFGFGDLKLYKIAISDVCYWIADIFIQYLAHAQFLSDMEREHCAWMAYTYSGKGLQAADKESEVQHRYDLEEVNRQAEEILLHEFGYCPKQTTNFVYY